MIISGLIGFVRLVFNVFPQVFVVGFAGDAVIVARLRFLYSARFLLASYDI
jgi:hypothetical protein